jgi:bacteriocin-like protein
MSQDKKQETNRKQAETAKSISDEELQNVSGGAQTSALQLMGNGEEVAGYGDAGEQVYLKIELETLKTPATHHRG